MAAFVAQQPEEMPRQVVLVGSPRRHGRSAKIASALVEGLSQAQAGEVVTFSVAELAIAGCRGCDACRKTGACIQHDDMEQVMQALDAASELHVVCPVYFAGPPAQMKALLDRLQPHYWRGTRTQPKRPAHLHVVGEGGDPHGYGPLVTIMRSALAVAGFALVDVEPHIMAEEGTR